MRTARVLGLICVLGVVGFVCADVHGQQLYRFEGDAAAGGADFTALDGTFSHDNGSDAWDETALGAGSPGGVSALTDGDTDYVRIQDPGDPRDYGMGDPSNRKVYLGHDLTADGASATLLDDGAVIKFRARIATDGPLDDSHPDGGGGVAPWPAGGDGYVIHDGGKGNISVKQAAGGVISMSLATVDDGGTAGLLLNNLNGNAVSGDVDTGEAGTANLIFLDATQWHEYEVRIRAGGSGTHIATVFVDGALAGVLDVTAGTGSDFDDITYVAIGCGSTGNAGAVDIDYISVAATGPAPEVPASSPWAIILLAVALIGAGAWLIRRRLAPSAA